MIFKFWKANILEKYIDLFSLIKIKFQINLKI